MTLSEKKIIKQKDEQITILKQELRGYKKVIKDWDFRYKRVIDEFRKINSELVSHAPKLLLLYFVEKYKKIKLKI